MKMLWSFSQDWNAKDPMPVKVSGKEILESREHLRNAWLPMLMIPSGRETDASVVQL